MGVVTRDEAVRRELDRLESDGLIISDADKVVAEIVLQHAWPYETHATLPMQTRLRPFERCCHTYECLAHNGHLIHPNGILCEGETHGPA